jgi:cobalt-zinc-cadmium efflux system membrane fusion protein
MKKQIIKACWLIGVISLIACSGGKNNAKEEQGINKAFLQHVKTTKAKLSKPQEELILTGKVECDPDRVITYAPLVSGVITRTYFSLGDKVTKGQAMLHIRSAELSSLQSELIVARRNLQSAESMFEDRLISEMELIEARAEYERLQADLSLYGENLGGGVFAIKAPMTGYVVEKNASPGSTVSEGDEPLFSIADLSTVWIMGNVHASDLLFVREGMKVEITTLSYPGEVFHGKINALSQVFDPEERVLKARIVMPNKELKFKPEMSVIINLKNKRSTPSVAIPSSALIFDNNRNYVVVESAGQFAIREVTLQGHYNKTTYISSGLEEGESVVVRNQLLVYSQLKEN